MSFRSRSLSALALAAAFGLGACSDAATEPATTPTGGPSLSAAAPQPSTAKFEVDYMEEVVDHHTAGLVMAQMCIDKAVHAELRALCQESLQSQSMQIRMLQQWLRDWYGISYTGEIQQSAAQDIRRLSALSGAEFENEFLTEFSKHHLQIIKLSEKAVRKVYHEELRTQIAERIIQSQSRQVVQMQTWDCQWYGDCRPGLINQVS